MILIWLAVGLEWSAFGQNELPFRVVGQWPDHARGSTSGVAVQGTYAYVCFSHHLEILDVSNPANPVRVGSYGTGNAQDVVIVGDYAYVADGWNGLQIVDVTNPANPVRVGSYDTGGSAQDLVVVGSYVYVAVEDGGTGRSGGLYVIDVSNPANPVRIGLYDTSGEAYGIAVQGSYAYVADGNAGLQVIDVNSPANPVGVGGYDTGYAYGVAVVGNYAYVADYEAVLHVIDVSNPTNPVRVGSYDTSGLAYGVTVAGNYAYIAAALSGLQVIDINNPANPVRVGGCGTSGNAQGVAVIGSYAYVADWYAGLQVIDVSDPVNPRRVGGYDTSGWAYDVAVAGNYAYLADGYAGLQVINVSNPVSPTRVGGYDTSGGAQGVVVVGNYAYVADQEAGLQIINVSNPANPVRAGGFDTTGLAMEVVVVGDYAYVADLGAGLQIINVSNPANPMRVGGCVTSGGAQDVVVIGNYAYIADREAGLQVIDVSNPTNPVRVGGYDTSGEAWGLAVSGNYAYVADLNAGLQIIDVSNPANPVRVGGCDFTWARGVRLVGNYAFVAAENTLVVVDIRNPTNPLLVDRHWCCSRAECLVVVGNHGYVADGEWGLSVVQVSDFKPEITQQPASQSAFVGESAVFNIVVQGSAPLGYRWYKNGAALADSEQFSGTGTSSLLVTNLQAGNEGSYTVLITNAFGSVTSQVATLTIAIAQKVTTQLVGQWNSFARGMARAIAIQGHHAYVAFDDLEIFDITNLANPIRVGGCVIPGTNELRGLAVQGNYVYAADWEAGLQVIDVSNPANPVRVGGYDTSGGAQSVAVVGSYAYVADWEAGLQVIDVSNPANPVRVGGYDTSGIARGIVVMGNYAYVADSSSGMQVIDVSNPANPAWVGGYDTSGTALNIACWGQYAYVSDWQAGLEVIDISDPANPVRVGRYDTSGYAYGVAVAGTRAYVADYDAGLQIIDISSPDNPQRIGGYDTTGQAFGVTVVGNYAYVADREAGLQVIDVSNPANPSRIGGYGASGYAYSVWVRGSYAYLADGDAGLQIIDVNNPAIPVRIGGYDTAGQSSGIALVGAYAYVADGLNGLEVIDVSNPANPTRIGGYNTSGLADRVVVVGNYAYVADQGSGLQVIDVINPASPTLIGGYDTSGLAVGIAVEGHYAYLADYGSGLQVFDVSNPASPVLISGYDTGGLACGVALLGSYACVSDGENGLEVIDVSNPANLVRVGRYDSSGFALNGVAVAGNRVFLPDRASGLQVIDISNPAIPLRVGGYDTKGDAYGVAVVDQYVYVADGAQGLSIIRMEISLTGIPQITLQPQSQSAAAGTTVNLLVTATGSEPLGYQWRLNNDDIAGATQSTLALANITPAQEGDYTVVVSNSLGSVTSQVATLIIGVAPEIVIAPASQQVAVNASVQFTVDAAGTAPLNYQWFHDSALMPGQTQTNLDLAKVQPTNAGAYVVVITNTYGAVTSTPAILTVTGNAPVFLLQPTNQVIPVGQALSFNIPAIGWQPISYQWFFNGTAVPGAKASILYIPAAQTNRSGLYHLQASNAFGITLSATSMVAVLPPITIVSRKTTNIVNPGETLTLIVEVSGAGPYHFQWSRNGVDIPNATNAILVLLNIQLSQNGNYRVRIGNVLEEVQADVSEVVVRNPLMIIRSPSSASVRVGDNHSFTVEAEGIEPLYYQWLRDDLLLEGQTRTNLDFALVQTSDAGAYVVVITNAYGSVTSTPAILTVTGDAPRFSVHPSSMALAVGQTLTFNTPAAGYEPIFYQWFFNEAPLVGATHFELSIPSIQTIHSGQYYLQASNFFGLTYSDSALVVVTQSAAIVIIQPPSNASVKQGDNHSFSVQASGTDPLYYQWFHDGTALSNQTRPNLSLISVQPSEAGAYVVVVTNAYGAVTSAPAILTVTGDPPQFSQSLRNQSVPQGQSLVLSSPALGWEPISYQWFFNGTALTGSKQFQLVIPSAEPGNAGQYYLQASNYFGSSTSAVATITVLAPLQVANTKTTNVLAQGNSLTLKAEVTGDGPYQHQWQINGEAIPGATNATYTITNAQPKNGGSYRVVVANPAEVIAADIAEVIIQAPQTPPGDNFADRIELTGSTGFISSSNNWATIETGEPKHAGKTGGHSIWFKWKPPYTGNARLSTAGSAFDTLLAVYRGISVNQLELITSDEDSGGFLTSALQFPVEAGFEYAVAVDGFAGATGRVVLDWSLEVTPEEMPQIVASPTNTVAPLGQTAALDVTAIGTNLRYQWYQNETPVPGANQSRLTLNNVQIDQVGSYRVAVINAQGTRTNWSAWASLEVFERIEGTAPEATPGQDKWEDLGLADEHEIDPLKWGWVREQSVGLQSGYTCINWSENIQDTTQASEHITGSQIRGHSRWFKWVEQGITGSTCTITTEGSEFATVLEVWRKQGREMKLEVWDQSGGGGGQWSEVRFQVAKNVSYAVGVSGIKDAKGKIKLTRRVELPQQYRQWERREMGEWVFALQVPKGVVFYIDESADLRSWRSYYSGQEPKGLYELRVGSDKAEGGRFYRARMYLGNTIEEQIGGTQAGQ